MLVSGSRAAASRLFKSCRGSVPGRSSVVPICRRSGGEELTGGCCQGCSQCAPCPQALPLLGFHFQKVGRKPELTLMWEPEEPEQESVPQVRPPARGGPTTPWGWCGGCVQHVDPVISTGTGPGGRAASQAVKSCCPSVSTPQQARPQPQPPLPSSPAPSHRCPCI